MSALQQNWALWVAPPLKEIITGSSLNIVYIAYIAIMQGYSPHIIIWEIRGDYFARMIALQQNWALWVAPPLKEIITGSSLNIVYIAYIAIMQGYSPHFIIWEIRWEYFARMSSLQQNWALWVAPHLKSSRAVA